MCPVATEVIQKIHELVGNGVDAVDEMRRAINQYVRSELFRDKQAPQPTNRAYYPSDQDFRNHMYRAHMKLR
jgi:hypothetical protein